MAIKSLQRIGWRFSEAAKRSDKSFKINQNDVDALKDIAQYVEQTQKEQYQANHLFAKLYVYMFMKILEQDGSTVFDNNARRKIGNVLKKPLKQLIEELQRSLNDSEQYGLLENLGIELKHPALRKEGETKKNMETINKLLESETIITDVFDFDTVEQAVMAEVNQQINLWR